MEDNAKILAIVASQIQEVASLDLKEMTMREYFSSGFMARLDAYEAASLEEYGECTLHEFMCEVFEEGSVLADEEEAFDLLAKLKRFPTNHLFTLYDLYEIGFEILSRGPFN